jgi:hypothetical protein
VAISFAAALLTTKSEAQLLGPSLSQMSPSRQSCPLRASKSNAHRWKAPGLVQRACSLMKFGRSARVAGHDLGEAMPLLSRAFSDHPSERRVGPISWCENRKCDYIKVLRTRRDFI